MFENLATISLIGFLIGFVFSIPIAGPLSIMITANALKGNMRYCIQANAGASLVVFVYVFIGIFGLTKLFALYYPFISYILIAGSLFLFVAGYKITRSNLNLDLIEKEKLEAKKNRKVNGFWTGLLINFFNPSLFVGWLTSSFIAITFLATLGYNTGGIDTMIQENLNEVNKIENLDSNFLRDSGTRKEDKEIHEHSIKSKKEKQFKKFPRYYPMIISFSYAFFLSLGSITWFFILTRLLIKYRKKLDISILNKIVSYLGYLLYVIGAFLFFSAITQF